MEVLQTDITEKAKEDYLNRCFELSGKKQIMYWCVANENDFYVNEKKEIIVKEGLPVHYREWKEAVTETIEVDGKEYTRTVENGKSIDVYTYAKQDRNYRGRTHTYIFEILDLEYSFKFYDGMYIGKEYSANTHIQMLYTMYDFNCFDERIKRISTYKSRAADFDIDLNYLGYEYKESNDLNDVPIYILYDRYGWSNECYYVLGLLDFLCIDYDKILKYAKPYIKVFRNLGINLEKTTPKQRIELFERILQRNNIQNIKRRSADVHQPTDYNTEKEDKKPICYIMKNKRNGFYKIGYSIDPKNREKTLQSEEPNIELIKVFKENHEKELHDNYSKYRVRGEWFKLSEVQLKYICTHFE